MHKIEPWIGGMMISVFGGFSLFSLNASFVCATRWHHYPEAAFSALVALVYGAGAVWFWKRSNWN